MTAARGGRRWIVGVAAALAAAACARDGASGPADADGDGVVAGYDCDDSDPAVHATLTAYPDGDRDGVGAGAALPLCTAGSLPSGWAAKDGDCAPADPTAWRATDLVDRDGDGSTARDALAVCAGATLPEPYRATASGNDCDDGNADLFRWEITYPDQDGDGVGARPRSIVCLGAALPAGLSRLGYDADDADPGVVRAPAEDDLALVLD